MASAGLFVALVALAALLAAVAAVTYRRRRTRPPRPRPPADLTPRDAAELGLSPTGPTIVAFTAPWCGPCAAVHRVVARVIAELPGVAHVEIDVEADPAAAARFSVLSLPTTLVFDGDGRQHLRTTAVPKPADLRAVLLPLLA